MGEGVALKYISGKLGGSYKNLQSMGGGGRKKKFDIA